MRLNIVSIYHLKISSCPGCVVASGELIVEKARHPPTIQQQQQQQQTMLLHQSTSVYKSEETTTTEKSLAPSFTRLPIHTQNQTIDVEEGKLLRLDCRVNGRWDFKYLFI
jgi:hypothetical protein